MKNSNIIIFMSLYMLVAFTSCQKNEVFEQDFYECTTSDPVDSESHPNASTYQSILEKYRKNGLVGASLLVKDRNGIWMGADGMADIASDVAMRPCNTFLIASISKVFTTAAVYRLVDKGLLTIDDPISMWLDSEVVEKVANADKAQIRHLLAHTSGIADYYTFALELDRINSTDNGWQKEDVLEFIYGVNPTNDVGETYYYSNSNFLILALILEKASGLSFEQVYQQEVFDPINLQSAYYSESQPIPDACVKGYVDIYNSGKFVESEFVYGDELGIGGDGGVAINAYDLSKFLEQLSKGNLISQSSVEQMTTWFDIPEDWHWDTYGQTENGFGIEKFNTIKGPAIGHSGGIDGFNTLGLYFPDDDMTYILFVNSIGHEKELEAVEGIYQEVIEVMFQ